jgi:hypothetical protein
LKGAGEATHGGGLMKVKVYVIDLPIPAFLKKWALRLAVPTSAILLGGVAFAGLPGGYADGQPLTAAALTSNFTYLQGEITTLQGALPSVSAFSYYQTVPQNFGSGAGGNVVFNAKDFDLGNEFSTATGVFTSTTGGLYEVTCDIVWNIAQTNGPFYFQTTVWKNNNVNTGIEVGLMLTPTYPHVEAHGLVKLAAGETLACQAYQSTSSTLATEDVATQNNSATRFSGIRIAP